MPPLEAPLIGIDRHRLATDGDGITTLVAFHECQLRCANKIYKTHKRK
jgi:pyruvate formate lyase activating enzyme